MLTKAGAFGWALNGCSSKKPAESDVPLTFSLEAVPLSPFKLPIMRPFLLFLFTVAFGSVATAGEPLKLLFLGDHGHHRPADRFRQLQPVISGRGIEMDYTDRVDLLSDAGLAPYDGLIIYANTTEISPDQEAALLRFVAEGKGFIPLHCASYCFLNSQAYIDLVGGQFKRHGTGAVRTEIVAPEHPVMQGFGGFESWDETYVHHQHNERNRTVLERRTTGMQADDKEAEPWTWVRTHGKGRVFYTAWGHDHRTWSEPGFVNLVERGIRWACGGDPASAGPYRETQRFVPPKMTSIPEDVKPFDYKDVGSKIPNYVPSNRWGVQGDPLTKMQLPLPPEESQEHYVVPEGFELQLFAAEPELGGKPIAMNWDAQGRLWVCETVDYPNELQADNRGRDRIRICEDTDGDGRADKFTIFAEELSIPTTLEFHRDGVIVQNGTETLYLQDTDGDDRADVREVLIRNWTLGDTHGGVSNFRYGPDNWFWAMQGYNNSAPEYGGEQSDPFRMGFFRFRLDDSQPPRVTDLEFIRSTSNNTWGLGISEEGLIFGSTANHAPSYFMPFANRYYEAVRGWSPQLMASPIFDSHLFDPITDNVRQVDHHGGYTAGAGHAVYTGRSYPQQWWNATAFVCGPTGHLVGTFTLTPEGAGFRSTSPSNLVASDDEWSAPIQAEVGPDGNVWILDWYNYIVQHNPTPKGFKTGKGNAYESDLRDKTYGRIYRLVCKPDQQPPGQGGAMGSAAYASLAEAPNQELIEALSHPTMLWRLRAQQLLVERNAVDQISQLIDLADAGEPDAAGINAGAMHALWTLAGLGAMQSPSDPGVAAAVDQFDNEAAGVRRAAVASLPPAAETGAAIVASQLLTDEDAQVRMAALLKLSELPADNRVAAVLADRLATGRDADDRWLEEATICAAAAHATPVLLHMSQQEASDAFPHSASTAATILANHIARGNPSSEQVSQMIARLKGANQQLVAALVTGIEQGWDDEHRIELSPAAEEVMLDLIDRVATETQSRLVGLAEAFGSQKLADYGDNVAQRLLDQLGDQDRPIAERTQTARRLVEFRSADEAIVDELTAMLSPQMPPELARGIIESLSASRAGNVGDALIELMPEMTPQLREVAIKTLLERGETTNVLLDGIEQGDVALADVSLSQQQALRNHPDRSLRQRAAGLMQKGGGIPNSDRQKVIDRLAAIATEPGDLDRGAKLYKKHCANCHLWRGEGGKVGPDLTGMAVHPKEELLIHILDPNRSVEGNYRTYTVLLEDGRVLNGLLASESRTSIELVDTEAKRMAISRGEIELLQQSRKSLMPEGFEQQMEAKGFADLLTFLTDTGPFVPMALDKVATVNTTQPMFNQGGSDAETLVLDDWSPRTFEGVPFVLIDPTKGNNNALILNGPNGDIAPQMPRSVSLPSAAAATKIHLLSGVSGWGAPYGSEDSVSMVVRLHYADGETEEHRLRNTIEFADYIRRVDVPGSKHAIEFAGGQQMRYLAIEPERKQPLESIELVKGPDDTAPIVMAMTLEK